MHKKFVQINANASPSSNPHEVRTFLGDCTIGPEWHVPCERPVRTCMPQTSTIAKVLTIEDELRRLHQKASDKRAELKERKRKKICPMAEDFLYCVEPQRSPAELKTHAITREKYLKTKAQLDLRIHDATKVLKDPSPSLVRLNSPMEMLDEEEEAEEEEEEDEEGADKKVKLRYATPSCSLDVIFVPPPRVLELKRPKSGLFHNSVDPPSVPDDGIPYVSYNPRELQRKFNEQGLPRIDIIDGKTSADMWTWNLGLQRRDSEMERAYMGARVSKFDCNNLDLTVYSIPEDIVKNIDTEVVFGNKNVQPQPEPRKRDSLAYCHRPPEIAALFAAYVETFRLSPDFWTAKTMDVVLSLGDKILKRSIYLNFKDEESDFDILKIIPERNAVVDIKVHFTGTLRNEPNIYKALSLYFFKYSAAILVSKNLHVLIWKRCSNTFFVFDPNGRNKNLQRSFIKGKCTLIRTRYVEYLVHLIVDSSGLDMNADFTLYGIVLVNYGKIVGEVPKVPFPKRYRKLWAVVNESYAIIPSSNTGIHQPMSGKSKNASMIISLFALLYGYIERPPLWTPGVLDDIIRYGNAYHRSLIKRLGLVKRVKRKKKYQHLNITDVPELYMMGAYKARHSKYPFLFSGHVADCNNFLDSQLTAAVRELYGSGWESALLQIDNSVLAIWRDNQLFYVFDPFRRGKAGQVLDPDDYRTKGAACLQMHTDFESFCRILHMKAIKMRRGGKFFLHGIRIGCIKPMIKLMYLKNEKYPHLKLDYPTIPMEEEEEDMYDVDGEGEDEGEYEDNEEEQAPVKPAKPKKVRKVLSIVTIPDVDLIPVVEEHEIAEQTLAEIICEILEKLPEPSLMPSTGYRQASKVLLRSDKEYLESLKYKLKHGEEFDNAFEANKNEPETVQPISLEQELLLPSNFHSLPDGSWVIFGHAILPLVEEEVSKLGGLLSCLIAVVLSAKYSIATWGPEIVDFALESVNNFGDQFKDYENVLGSILAKKIPDVQIGENCYCLGVHKIIRSGVMQSLRQVLLECLFNFNRFLVICQRYSCVIIRRHNFLYMFVGFACNTIGYRKFSAGPACLLRFVELDSLIRRLEYGCNPEGCEISNYIIVAMKVADITGGGDYRFREWRDKEKDLIYDDEYQKHWSREERRRAKRDFLNSELSKESKRVDRFTKDKKSHKERMRLAAANRCKKLSKYKLGGPDYTDYLMHGEEEEYMEEEEEEEIPIQHKPGTYLPREVPDKFKPQPLIYGYRRRNNDNLFKIQGSKALEDRMTGAIDEIKACFFTSALAVIYAVLRPLNEWNPQRMDRVIEQGKQLTKRISNFKTASRRVLKNVTVDDYELNVWIKVYEVPGVWGFDLNYQIDKALQTRHYILLQISNCTFVIYRDQVYHLFDPYPSMEKSGQDEENEEEEEKELNEATDMPERNTASWVLFADVESLLEYIDKRALNPDWQKMFEFHFHVVDIASYKKAAPQSRILQLLTDTSIPMVCKVSPHSEDESDICAHNENISWLEMENSVPIWSRLNRRNAAGKYRGLPVSKAKKYDVEIEGRLWSLWGTLHPMAPCFPTESRGKQFLACNVLACCAARIYRLADFSCQLLDNIIISGDRYHRESLKRIQRTDYEFSLEDLNLECVLESIKFIVHLEHVAYGRLYCIPSAYQMNLAEGLMYFFGHFQFGILQVRSRSLAIGRIMDHDGGYFMFDCQTREHPLFPMGQGASYLLRTRHLQVLLYCITVALAIPHHNVQYTLHKVEILRKGAAVEEEEDQQDLPDEPSGDQI